MKTNWYASTYRKLFFDFHSPAAAVGLAADFDAERWAERLQAANAQAVSVFTKCGFGWSFYQKGKIRYQHPHLPAGRDLLEEQINALHKRGLKALGYYHTFTSEPIAHAHPDWIMRKFDDPDEIEQLRNEICLLGPLAEEWMLPHIEEIVSNYDVDSMFFDGTYAHSVCYCPSCQERFAAESGGLALPKVPPGWNAAPQNMQEDPAWPIYVAWSLKEHRRLRQRICETIHRVRPDVVVSFNWFNALRGPEVVPDGIGALVADIFPDDQVTNGSYFSSYWATQNRPFDVMNSAFLQWWGDWASKPAIAMQQEVSTTLAHGGLTWIGYQMTHRFDVPQAVMDELGKTLAFVREREPWLEGAAPIPNVAVLQSTSAHLAAPRPQLFVDELSLRGAHRLLTESMLPFHFLHEEGLLDNLSSYRAVILPDQYYLPDRLVKALAEYVQAGGALIVTGQTGTLDENYRKTGRFALQDLLGLEYAGLYDQTIAYIDVTDERLKPGALAMPHLVEAPFVFTRPVAENVAVLARLYKAYLRSDGKYLLRWSPIGEDSGCPAITLRRVGRGQVSYIAGDVFRGYQVKNQWNLKPIIANLLDLMIPDPILKVKAPAWLEVTLMRQGLADGRKRTLLHLVNQHGDRPLDGNYRCSEQVLPVRDIQVELNCPTPPTSVTLEPGGEALAWQHQNHHLMVQVPEVHIHRIVAVE